MDVIRSRALILQYLHTRCAAYAHRAADGHGADEAGQTQ